MTTTLKKLTASIIALALLSALPVQASVGIGQSQTSTLTNGLVGYWTFDGKDINWKTGQVTDRSGQGNGGQTLGMSTTTSVALGKIGQSLQFSRSTNTATQSVVVQDSTSLSQTGSGSFTTSFWVKPSVLCDGGNQNYLEKAQDSATPGWGLYMQGTCSLNARLAYTGARVDVVASVANVNANFATSTWTHVVFVVNRSTNLAQWYFNGKAIGSPTSISSLGDMTNTKTLDIGAGRQGLGVDTVGGSMDDVRIYSRALSAQEIQQLYVSGGGKISQSQTNTLTNGLVGYWTLDGKDTNWKTGVLSDASNNGNTCNVRSGLATTSTVAVGKVGQAFVLKGVDTGYADCGDPSAFQTNQQTLVAWIKTSNAGTNFRSIVAKSLAFGLYLVNNVLGTYDNGTSQTRVSTGLLNDNKWHQVAIAFNSGATNGTFMYVDGVLVASTTVTITNSAQSMKIGYGQAGGQVFNGQIDDVRVYNRQLSAQEVAQLYASDGGTVAQSNATLLQTGLLGYWTLDGKDIDWKAGQVFDRSGQGNTGQMTGVSTTSAPTLGKVGQALQFTNGSSVTDWITVSNEAPFEFTSAFTVSVWLKASTSWGASYRAILGKFNGNGWDLGLNINGTSRMTLRGSSVLDDTSTGVGPDLRDGKWHHLVKVSTNTSITTYIDGTLVGSTTGTWTPTTNTVPLVIGNRQITGGTADMLGALDEVRIYNRALSAQEVQQLYASTK